MREYAYCSNSKKKYGSCLTPPQLLVTCQTIPVIPVPPSADFTCRMIPHTSQQSQDHFQDCLGFARQLSKSPGVYCRLEVKVGENSFFFQTEKIPGKRKSPSDYRRDFRGKQPLGVTTTPGEKGVGAPGRSKGALLKLLPAAELFPGPNTFSPLLIYQSWTEVSWKPLERG